MRRVAARKAIAEESDSDSDSDSEDTVVVECSRDDITEKTIDGKIYLMEKDDSENLLYDTGTGECVGIYDEENDAVMPLEELDSDSDSD